MSEVLRSSGGRVRLASMLQLVEMESLSGRLEVGELGEIGAVRGAPVAARTGELEGREALLELFMDPVEQMVFQAEELPLAAALGPLMSLVIEGCRLADEWERLAPRVLRVQEDMEPSESVARVLETLDGMRPLWDAVAAASCSRAAVADELAELLELGALAEAGEPVPPLLVGPGRASMDFDGWLNMGRKLARDGELISARQAFRQALALQPDDRVAAQNLRRVEALANRMASQP